MNALVLSRNVYAAMLSHDRQLKSCCSTHGCWLLQAKMHVSEIRVLTSRTGAVREIVKHLQIHKSFVSLMSSEFKSKIQLMRRVHME